MVSSNSIAAASDYLSLGRIGKAAFSYADMPQMQRLSYVILWLFIKTAGTTENQGSEGTCWVVVIRHSTSPKFCDSVHHDDASTLSDFGRFSSIPSTMPNATASWAVEVHVGIIAVAVVTESAQPNNKLTISHAHMQHRSPRRAPNSHGHTSTGTTGIRSRWRWIEARCVR